jgi:hypothetical protein
MRRRLLAPLVLVAALALGAAGYFTSTVTGSANGSISLTESATTSFTGVKASVTPTFSLNQSFTSGTGSGAIDVKWCIHDTVAASASDTVDLAGSRTNEFGATVTFAKVKVIAVKAATTNTNDVWVGGAAANRFNSFLKDSSVAVVRPGYMLMLWGPGTGYTVTAATADKLLLKNSSGTTPVVFDFCAGGTSS